ncbi:MAG: nucleotidyltransferase family protein [Candidatus Coatesbacteria bacterium]|nr:nucleotidyltransferase family protein [Candidatus Coatesbacteria bacterium]
MDKATSKPARSASQHPSLTEIASQYGLTRREAKSILKRAGAIASEQQHLARTQACRILMGACGWMIDPARGRPQPPGDDLTFQSLVALGRQHGLLPILYTSLKREARSSAADSLAQESDATGRANLRALSELEAILIAAREANVRIIPIKGPTVAFSVYTDPALRPFADIDLLIEASDFAGAEAVLTTLGYEREPGLLPPRFYLKHHIHLPYSSPSRTKVELHWGLTHRFRPWCIPVDEVVSRAAIRTLNGVEAPCFSDEDHFIYLCTHLEEHGYYSRYAADVSDEAIIANPDVNNRLIWLLDVAMMMSLPEAQLDWEGIVKRSCGWGVGGHVCSVLSLSDRLLGVGAPAWVLQQLPRLKPYRFERTLARYIALWPDRYTLDRGRMLPRIHRFLLSRIFRMHPSLQFRPSRVFDLVRYVFSEGAGVGPDGGAARWRSRPILGAPFRLMRPLSMATSIVVHYVRRAIGVRR